MLRLALIAAALLPASCGTTLGVATSARGAVRTVHSHAARAHRLRGGEAGAVRHLEEASEWPVLHAEAGDALVVADFTAVWCGPCQKIAPVYEALAAENPSVHFVKIDVDELGELAAQLGVTSMPTFLFYRNGEQIDAMKGADEGLLRAKVAEHAAAPAAAPASA